MPHPPVSQLKEFYDRAWTGYAELTPDAPLIHRWLEEERGERIINDHVAFRTFDLPGIARHDIGRIFEAWGYRRAPEELDFPEKKLKASYWLHADPAQPKVFVSELLIKQVSPGLQAWIRGFAGGFAARVASTAGGLAAAHLLERGWEPVRFEDYERFYAESEYAAWTAAFGIRVNHFTVLINSLKSFRSLQELNEFLVGKGATLNSAGGAIKGTPSELLEQSSTMARKVEWGFAGGKRKPVMGCYYEFARRYPMPGTSELFPGFIPKSADKIFESTFERR